MKLRTEIVLPAYEKKISYTSSILCLGSCFANAVGERLAAFKFDTLINPFGISFNPHSMAAHIKSLDNTPLDDQIFVLHDDLWHSFLHHGSFSNTSKEKLLESIREMNTTTNSFIKKADCIILTFGTANVYRHRATNLIVANNHKLPEAHFSRERLSITSCFDAIMDIIKRCKLIHPNVNFILTVSPVRHIRDGLIENQRSKSTLILAVEKAVASVREAVYFPSFEIMNDDLRDYRFYADDLIHPSKIAVDYIWEKFKASFMESPTLMLIDRVQKLNNAFNHRPLHSARKQWKNFVLQQLSEIKNLKKTNPNLDLSKFQTYFENILKPS